MSNSVHLHIKRRRVTSFKIQIHCSVLECGNWIELNWKWNSVTWVAIARDHSSFKNGRSGCGFPKALFSHPIPRYVVCNVIVDEFGAVMWDVTRSRGSKKQSSLGHWFVQTSEPWGGNLQVNLNWEIEGNCVQPSSKGLLLCIQIASWVCNWVMCVVMWLWKTLVLSCRGFHVNLFLSRNVSTWEKGTMTKISIFSRETNINREREMTPTVCWREWEMLHPLA